MERAAEDANPTQIHQSPDGEKPDDLDQPVKGDETEYVERGLQEGDMEHP